MSLHSTMTAIADNTRTLSGITDKLKLDDIDTNLDAVVEETDLQFNLLQQIKLALNGKGLNGGGDNTGGVQLPTLSNPGTANDLAQGKQLIGSYGQVIEGAVSTYTNYNQSCVPEESSGQIIFEQILNKPIMLKGNSLILQSSLSNFGNALPSQVAKGVTFTSSSGLEMEGTMEQQQGGNTSSPAMVTVQIAEATPNSNALSIVFEDLEGEPTLFTIDPIENINISTTRIISNVSYNSKKTIGSHVYRASSYNSNATSTYSDTAYSYTYANGQLTITSNGANTGGYFGSGITYQLLYVIDTLNSGGGIQLPTLTNQGTANDLMSGKQLINSTGGVVTGNFSLDNELNEQNDFIARIQTAINNLPEPTELPTLTNPGSTNDLAQGKQLIDENGEVITGMLREKSNSILDAQNIEGNNNYLELSYQNSEDTIVRNGTTIGVRTTYASLGNATAADVAKGKTFTSASGLLVEGQATFSSGGGGSTSTYPDGAFTQVNSFTDGKQYALVALIDGNYRYINTTTYNNYTMNATAVNILEDAGDYVIFSDTPALFTAVSSGNGFLLQNGSNYLCGTTSNGTALRVNTTQAVWTTDNSATGGFSSGKYLVKENPNSVWLFNNSGGYDWSIKYETAGSFGYDRNGRDNTYSTGFTSFILYEYVAGESGNNNNSNSSVVDTSDANATAFDLANGTTAYVNGQKIEGALPVITNSISLCEDEDCVITMQSNSFIFTSPENPDRRILDEGANVVLAAYTSQFGDAKPEEVAAGKYFTSTSGLRQVGTATIGGGSTIKTGTTTSGTINTGLSNVEQFFIYKESQNETGLIHLHYTPSATSRLYASAWSTSTWGTKTITNGTGGVTVNGGTVTISATQAAQGALSSNITYKWVAIGT